VFTNKRVFITGVGFVSPLGLDVATNWANLKAGVSGVGPITLFDAEGFTTTIAAEVKGFDPYNYMDRKEVGHADRFTWFAVAATQQAVAQAQLKIQDIDPYRFGVVVSTGIGGIITLSQQHDVLRDRGPRRVSPFLLPMFLADMASGQVTRETGANGPNYCLTSSCSSSADALIDVCRMILMGEIDIGIAGGTEAGICPIGVAGFSTMHALSRRNDDPQKASRPFDKDRDGFVMGEGSAILILESGESAASRGVQPWAEIIGYGQTSDAHHPTDPEETGQIAAAAMRFALDRAYIRPEEIDYFNAHGTSTPKNDIHETKALKLATGEAAFQIPISSTKSMTGHMLGAGGSYEAGLCGLVMEHGVIPPTINLENPGEGCDLDYTPNKARHKEVNVVMTASFGFGGHNSVLILAKPDWRDRR